MAWQSVAMETAAMGGTQGPMRDCGPGSSMRRRYIGAHGRLGAWQQLWEARNLPAPYVKKFNTPAVCVRRPESGTWQSVAMETAAMGGRTGDP
ncbi:unnamed protein product [Staurois parvus]|uniref:Uncharacterized protein n=1 Tax=Staurois parvus TaxID=386267 RepID=A0ABN9GS62_9NEOB|nr:unnamed protein product [Staurois parvus]